MLALIPYAGLVDDCVCLITCANTTLSPASHVTAKVSSVSLTSGSWTVNVADIVCGLPCSELSTPLSVCSLPTTFVNKSSVTINPKESTTSPSSGDSGPKPDRVMSPRSTTIAVPSLLMAVAGAPITTVAAVETTLTLRETVTAAVDAPSVLYNGSSTETNPALYTPRGTLKRTWYTISSPTTASDTNAAAKPLDWSASPTKTAEFASLTCKG